MKRILLILVFIFSLFGVFADLTTDNQVYYSFDDDSLSGSNPLDLSGNGNDGTNNGTTTGVTGILDEAFNYDGTNDYVTTNSSLTSSGSISFWVNFDTPGSLEMFYDNLDGIK